MAIKSFKLKGVYVDEESYVRLMFKLKKIGKSMSFWLREKITEELTR